MPCRPTTRDERGAGAILWLCEKKWWKERGIYSVIEVEEIGHDD